MRTRRHVTAIAGVLIVVAALATYLIMRREAALPSTDSPTYQQVVRAFYRGLASLDTGLLDTAKNEFRRATELVPQEAASWANLGVAHLRAGEFDAASQAIAQAAARAPESAEVAMMQGGLDSARGRLDEAIAAFRRAAALDPRSIRARFSLAEVLDRASADANTAEVERSLDAILALQPDNLAVILERARLAVRRQDGQRLDQILRELDTRANGWPAAAVEQLTAMRAAATARDFAAAARATAFLRNVLARVPEYRESLAAVRVPGELIAEPLQRFVALPSPRASPSEPDMALTFSREEFAASARSVVTITAWPTDTSAAVGVFAVDDASLRRVDGAGAAWTLPAPLGAGRQPVTLVPLDWNHDFRTDLLVTSERGLRLFVQNAGGAFSDATPAGNDIPTFGAWAADVEMDGDLDVVVGAAGGMPVVLRNNGNGSWTTTRPFDDVSEVRGFAWGDVDRDGDPDAVMLDAAGNVHLFVNQQAGQFERRQLRVSTRVVALTTADLNADGRLDVVMLDQGGVMRRAAADAAQAEEVARFDGLPSDASPGRYRILVADLDNNGGLDLIASGPNATRIWLSDEKVALHPLAATIDAETFGVHDLNGDGLQDLVGLSSGRPVRFVGRGQRQYHWQVIRVRAQTTAGDQRINAFGVGGELEARSGLLFQKHLLTGAPVHLGLGERTAVDVARIVWPNGVVQSEFDLRADRDVVAEQRLKGSCPWVFAYDGHEMRFVTDFLWRSPLGLRINAQDTAGSNQTEDWIKIRGDQLLPRDGIYDVRITAELWESHFFDHVSLMAVDHEPDVEVYVDERFARQPPSLTVHPLTQLTPVARARDDEGRDVTALVRARDGRHVAGFSKGAYQGVAREHVLEFDIGSEARDLNDLWLVASGWVYPTDSSINVAIAQGGRPAPHGLALEAQDATGAWRVLAADLGFPAGKNKTIVIPLTGRPDGAQKLRLRTDMEVYWDALAYGRSADEATLRTTRLAPTRAELRYRGYSRTVEDKEAHAPETPLYGQLANTAPRWRDLVGYHTRFGDVMPLLASVDDRYVIMNAGDELALAFAALGAPPAGWTRDFVLIGDGWEKDGDFNTGYSQTVQPLPLHDRPDYVATSGSLTLEDDPAYQRHPDDWQTYHTRFVSPDRYLEGLRPR